MEFNSVVYRRKSVRDFKKKKKPSWKFVLDAIDLANQGAYANNDNHLKFLIVEDSSMIKNISNFCEQSWIQNSSLVVLVLSDDANLERIYGERGRVYSRQQAGAAIQTFILALANQGVDSCWVGAYSDELIKSKLKIPQHIQVEAVIPLGYEHGKSKKPEKKTLESSIFWEEWNNDRRPSIFEASKDDFGRPIKK